MALPRKGDRVKTARGDDDSEDEDDDEDMEDADDEGNASVSTAHAIATAPTSHWQSTDQCQFCLGKVMAASRMCELTCPKLGVACRRRGRGKSG